MKPEQDDINWHYVHRTHEGNPQPFEDPDQQYWQQMLADINQKIHNLEHVSLPEPVYAEKLEGYTTQKLQICQQLEKTSR